MVAIDRGAGSRKQCEIPDAAPVAMTQYADAGTVY
jgi:hypothetical protein